ncbi:MAG TPA: bifunctional riboflavin kinase/FAD synthetase [Gammaproteobacteria bacterium]|nr:bifunctional riboflavin kinase/FAD synthetase [Gammaproteobacteria bacterium]
MELIRGLVNFKPRHRGCAASIGNYDGVHLGHQHVLRQLVGYARALSLPATVVVFEPMPLEYFAGAEPPARLMNFCEKWAALAECGVDRVACLRFNRTLAQMSAEMFIERVLIHDLGVRHLVVGDDFRFGRERAGDFAMLKDAGEAYGFEVQAAHTLSVAGERVSSGRIRGYLAAGKLGTAAGLLGMQFSLSGRVVYGDRLGHVLGYPTANIPLKRRISPVHGIFVAAVHGIGGTTYYGAAYVGSRPTVNGQREMLEVTVFDFSGELYGQRLRVELLHQLRGDTKFENMEALKAQITRDVGTARTWLKLQGMD